MFVAVITSDLKASLVLQVSSYKRCSNKSEVTSQSFTQNCKLWGKTLL